MEAFAVVSWSMLLLLTALPFFLEIACAAAQFMLLRRTALSIAQLRATAAHLKKEIAKITSPADFVTRAKHERELIAVEKKVEGLNERKASTTKLFQNASRIIKGVLYFALVALCWGHDVVVVDARLLWPLTTLSPFHNPLFGVAIGAMYLLPLSVAASNTVASLFFVV